MEEHDTKTPNGGSLTREEGEKLKNNPNVDGCRIVVANLNDLTSSEFNTIHPNKIYIDVTGNSVRRAPEINEGILPGEEGNTFETVGATEIGAEGIVYVVIDGVLQFVPKKPENEPQRIAREAVETAKSANNKFNQNNPAKTSTTGKGPDRA